MNFLIHTFYSTNAYSIIPAFKNWQQSHHYSKTCHYHITAIVSTTKNKKYTRVQATQNTHRYYFLSGHVLLLCPGLAQTLHRCLLVPGRDGSGTCRAAEEVGMLSGMSLLLSLDFVLVDGASLLEPLGLAWDGLGQVMSRPRLEWQSIRIFSYKYHCLSKFNPLPTISDGNTVGSTTVVVSSIACETSASVEYSFKNTTFGFDASTRKTWYCKMLGMVPSIFSMYIIHRENWGNCAQNFSVGGPCYKGNILCRVDNISPLNYEKKIKIV